MTVEYQKHILNYITDKHQSRILKTWSTLLHSKSNGSQNLHSLYYNVKHSSQRNRTYSL